MEGETVYAYDGMNRLTGSTDAGGGTTSYQYDGCGNLTQVTDPLGNVTAFAYDAMNNQIRECLSGEEGETCVTLYRYDKLGRMIKEINPLLDEKTYAYDGNGNVISILDEDGNETTVRYDLNNRPAGMCYSDGREALFRYNKRGELVEMQDWNGTAVMEYGRTGRLWKTTDHNGYTTGYEYDANGNITGITYPDGSEASYAFDKNNRMIKVEGAEGKAAAYRYDPMGNIASIQLPGSVSSYIYNQKGLPVKAAYQFDDGTLMEESYSVRNAGPSTHEEFRVFGHGNENGIQLNKKILNADEVACLIRGSEEYVGGSQQVILYACETGKNSDGFAQQLANNLGVNVKAPNKLLYPTKTGGFIVAGNDYHKGKWITFTPKN